MKKRLIAINLPQFHPFKENDEWWGKGFTEWTNVTKAKPRFRGHYQPHLPSDTGFYDLRLPESREMQSNMAKQYGIYGFCYYHYWFNGKRLMERPVNEIIESGKPDFPFMLCWANENWSRNWDGGFHKVLIKQDYSENDDIEHMEYLCNNVFTDKRYIRVNNKPFFIIYKPELFPDIEHTINTWRKVAKAHDIELYLGFMNREDDDSKCIYLEKGFDVAIDFQPHVTPYIKPKSKRLLDFSNLPYRLWRKFSKSPNPFNIKLNYKKYVNKMSQTSPKEFKQFPGITPGWDNSPRRVGKGYFALLNSTPQTYGKWLKHILLNFKPFSEEENFIFINAWNEWAEGNHLEPDQKWGDAYLKETLEQIKDYNM